MTTQTTTRRGALSDKHKAALAEGRTNVSIVNRYLHALGENKPKRGRKRTTERVKEELAQVEQELPDAVASRRLLLIQRRMDLTKELEAMGSKTFDIKPFETEFVKIAKPYSAAKGIAPQAWIEFGVPRDVLKKAGITRANNKKTNGNGNGNGKAHSK